MSAAPPRTSTTEVYTFGIEVVSLCLQTPEIQLFIPSLNFKFLYLGFVVSLQPLTDGLAHPERAVIRLEAETGRRCEALLPADGQH